MPVLPSQVSTLTSPARRAVFVRGLPRCFRGRGVSSLLQLLGLQNRERRLYFAKHSLVRKWAKYHGFDPDNTFTAEMIEVLYSHARFRRAMFARAIDDFGEPAERTSTKPTFSLEYQIIEQYLGPLKFVEYDEDFMRSVLSHEEALAAAPACLAALTEPDDPECPNPRAVALYQRLVPQLTCWKHTEVSRPYETTLGVFALSTLCNSLVPIEWARILAPQLGDEFRTLRPVHRYQGPRTHRPTTAQIRRMSMLWFEQVDGVLKRLRAACQKYPSKDLATTLRSHARSVMWMHTVHKRMQRRRRAHLPNTVKGARQNPIRVETG